jgi:hypothetical protein
MRKYFFLILCSAFAIVLSGQTTFKKNDVYLEIGGNGLFASANYERQLTKQPGPGIRLGIGVYSENGIYLTLPAGIDYLFNLKADKSFIDAGMGITWTFIDAKFFGKSKSLSGNNFFPDFIPSIGYRQHTANNIMWRVSLAPVINKYGFVPWLGLSFGKRF